MKSFWARHWALVGALGWVVGTGFIVAIVMHARDEAEERRSMSVRGTATLVGYTQSNDRDRRNRQTVRRFEIYEFQPDTGQRVRFSSPILGAEAPRQLGESVAILYPAFAPQAAHLVDDGLPRVTRMLYWIVPFGLLFALPFLIIWLKGVEPAQ
jgi:hypothetical protein